MTENAKRSEILATASSLINGARQATYGTPEQSFGRIARIWSVLLDVEIAPWQVAQMMAALKLARSVQSPEKDDSWVDLAGYAALAAELAPLPVPTQEAVAAVRAPGVEGPVIGTRLDPRYAPPV